MGGQGSGGKRANSGRPKKGSKNGSAQDDCNKRKKTISSEELRKQMNERQKRERDRQRKEQLEKHLKRQRDAIEKIREMAQLDTFIERGLDGDEGDNGNEEYNDDVGDYTSYEDEDGDIAALEPNTVERRRKQRALFSVGKDSPLGKEMKEFKNRVKKSIESQNLVERSLRKKFWHNASVDDPVISFNATRPKPSLDNFYRDRFWCFLWDPTYQFGNNVSLNEIQCPRCKLSGNLTLNEWIYRPMFHHGQLVWVLHHSIQCSAKDDKQGCGKYCTSIDPHVMSQLPTNIARCFPFCAPLRGPGMHIDMVRECLALTKKQISFGTYANTINRIMKTTYFERMNLYYETASDAKVDVIDNLDINLVFEVCILCN